MPVTFGGGITTVKGSLSSGVLLKKPDSVQCLYHFSSDSLKLKFLLSSMPFSLFATAKVSILQEVNELLK